MKLSIRLEALSNTEPEQVQYSKLSRYAFRMLQSARSRLESEYEESRRINLPAINLSKELRLVRNFTKNSRTYDFALIMGNKAVEKTRQETILSRSVSLFGNEASNKRKYPSVTVKRPNTDNVTILFPELKRTINLQTNSSFAGSYVGVNLK